MVVRRSAWVLALPFLIRGRRYTGAVPTRRLAGYLLREVTWLYLLGVGAFCLLLSIDLLTSWASFLIDYDASLAAVGRLMLFKLPWFLHLSLPVAGVFAVLLATGRLAKDSELKAAYALGVPPLALFGPLLAFGLLVSAIAVVNNGYLEPRGERASAQEIASFYSQRPPVETQTDVSYFVEGEGIYYAGRIRSDENDRRVAHLSGVTVIRDDGTVLSAPAGTWDSREQSWQLRDVERLAPDGSRERLGSLNLPFAESDAGEALARAETLTLSELWQRLTQLRALGADTREVAFQFHRRVADAFSAMIFILIAGALGLQLQGRSAGFGWTIALLVFFFFLWTFSENLFAQRVLSPALAAWFTSGVVGALGLGLAVVRLR